MLNIENMLDKVELDENTIEKLKEALEKVTLGEGIEYDSEVNLYIVDDIEMAEINKEQRDKDGTTDVLSFPLIAYKEGKTFKESYNEENLRDEMFLEDSLLLGDVVISYDRVISQSEEYGHSMLRELIFLFVHSILHLLGYDHMNEEERIKMREKEDHYMQILGILR